MTKVFPRFRLLCRHNKPSVLLLLLLFLLTESSFNGLLCEDTTTIENSSPRVANEFEGHGGKSFDIYEDIVDEIDFHV